MYNPLCISTQDIVKHKLTILDKINALFLVHSFLEIGITIAIYVCTARTCMGTINVLDH